MIEVSSDITLQSLEERHHGELFKLMQSIYPSAYGHFWKDNATWYLDHIYSKTAFIKDLNEEDCEYYFVRFRESVIGILKLALQHKYPPLADTSSLKIQRLYLNPNIQGRGIGKQLVHYATRCALSLNHPIICLDAMDTHTQAQQFYKGLGFQKGNQLILDFKLLHDRHRGMWYMYKKL